MERLHHSYAGHLRLMQMSTIKLYVFVEGIQCDPYFFSQVCTNTINSSVSFEISTAQQLPGESGGKQTILNFFTYLRKRQALFSSFGGKLTTCIFFLDKDIDDLKRQKKRSPHIVYTKYYDVQNYVFEYGDLVKGSAAAASVDPRRLEGYLNDSSRWCKHVATLWKDWIALCISLQDGRISGVANYKVQSKVQTRPCGPTDQEALNLLINEIALHANYPVAQLRSRLVLSRKREEKYLQKEEHHRIFKGKWFCKVLADDINRIMAGKPYDDNKLSMRLPSAIATTLNFTQAWVNDFKGPLLNIVSMLDVSGF
jgi:hypothetical protein